MMGFLILQGVEECVPHLSTCICFSSSLKKKLPTVLLYKKMRLLALFSARKKKSKNVNVPLIGYK